MIKNENFDVVVAGGGPAGLAAAVALARLGFATALVTKESAAGGRPDNRTAALFTGSITFLRNLGVWDGVAAVSAPISAIRILDDTGALLKAPEVVFTAAEIGLDAFGYNVPNSPLVDALLAVARRLPLAVIEAGVAEVAIAEDGVTLALESGARLRGRLVVGADGRRSLCRQAAGIATDSWSYDQAALTTSFTHQRPHAGVSTEFHRPAGPFTTVPLPGTASSLVWVERPEVAERLAALDDQAFRAMLEDRLQGLLGPIGTVAPRARFPLSGLTARGFARNRVALVGEAGHVVPPIGAQGLNLGLRDAAWLADSLADGRAKGRDCGDPVTLARYTAARRIDVAARIWTIDILNRSLLSSLLPVHLARGLGLHALKALAPLRQIVVREGLAPSGATPRLMQPDAGGVDLTALAPHPPEAAA
ncbi:MAG: UbiH/UbiF family hydroxylase [Pseudomonadota bacterium]